MKFIFAVLMILTGHVYGDEWADQKAFFEKHGYLVLRNFYSEGQTRLLKDWADEIHRESLLLMELSQTSGYSIQELAKTLPQALIVVPEADKREQVCRAEDMLTCYPLLHALIAGTIAPYIESLEGEPYVLFKDKLNFKWPGGGAFPPHQDFPAFDFFGPRIHVTAMVAIDPATIENGCLQVADDWCSAFAGNPAIDSALLSDGRAVLPYIQGGKNHGSIQPAFSEKIKWRPIEALPGDVILISSFVPHYSEPNRSKLPRRAMLFTLNRLVEGDHRSAYYYVKRNDFDNPAFHFATPTNARSKD
jgi:ectoine hydroxylase-related dioxygenase (phytanoyl-CoA dioxygenase family)